jgi:threonine dehydratase
MRSPTAQGVLDARRTIDPVFLSTPLRRSGELDWHCGARIVFKDETVNPIKSFKGRGACAAISACADAGEIVCASAGIFGQGLAWAVRRTGQSLVVFAAQGAVACKIDAMRGLGATVRREGADFDAAKDAARAHALRSGACFIEDGARPEIAEGAGTMAQELTENGTVFDVVLVPLGNGALVSGIGTWMKHVSPRTQVIAVAAAGAPAMMRSLQSGFSVETAATDTIADGLAVRVPVPYALQTVRAVIDGVISVDDSTLLAAMRLLRDGLGLVIEPAGAAGLAAVLADRPRWKGARIAIPLCGGNVGDDILNRMEDGRA